MISYLLFDLDNTLYLPNQGPLPQVDRLMTQFIVEKYQLSPEKANQLRQQFVQQYGTTMEGLVRHFNTDPIEFLEYVHAVEDHYLPKEDPKLRSILESIPYPKYILTNSYKSYAQLVLGALKIKDLFQDIFDIVAMGFKNKVNPECYSQIIQKIDSNKKSDQFMMFDDIWNYLASAKKIGIKTVLVNPEYSGTPDFHIKTIYEIPKIVLEL